MDKINKLKSIPQYEQRSEQWFKQREGKLTSSDAGTVLGINPYQKPHEVLFKKCGHDPKPFVGNVATLHGQKYEDEAIEKYCQLTGQCNHDFGLIAHEDVHNNDDYYWLAGSPDGISISKYKESKPILLEVKCPYRRPIKIGYIPEYYYPQVQLNMFICNLEVADFIEYKPPDVMNIVRVKIDHVWLNKNLPILEKFWKDVEYYRQNDIKCHPKYKPPKKILDLRDNSDDNDDVCLPKEILIRDV
jgi:putative phage-type endonuclease